MTHYCNDTTGAQPITNAKDTFITIQRMLLRGDYHNPFELIKHLTDTDLYGLAAFASIAYAQAIQVMAEQTGADLDVVLTGMGLRSELS